MSMTLIKLILSKQTILGQTCLTVAALNISLKVHVCTLLSKFGLVFEILLISCILYINRLLLCMPY